MVGDNEDGTNVWKKHGSKREGKEGGKGARLGLRRAGSGGQGRRGEEGEG